MKPYILTNITLLIVILLPSSLISQNTAKNDVKVFLLAGQSNMDGYGFTKDLPDALDTEYENVFIYHGNSLPDGVENGGVGKWETLKPGHGVNFSSTTDKTNLSDRFGIELSFAKKLQEYYPNQKLAFIKYSRGGTSIDSLAAGQFGSWEADFKGSNGINQYDNALNTINLALKTKDIDDDDGKDDNLIPAGIIWMQGESDASYSEEIAANYYSNLKRLMDLLRASLRTDDLPIVIGKISDSWNDSDGKVWDYGELVQYAQEKYAKEDKNATIVRSTRYYKYSDKWHYDSDGYIDLGEKFADAIYQLNKQ